MINKKIVGIIDEAPYDYRTWSGSSRYFFNALKKKQRLYNVYSAELSDFKKKLYMGITFSCNMDRWKNRYHLCTNKFDSMSKNIEKKLVPIRDDFSGILQIGAWYNLTKNKNFKNKFFCSYHDGNLATQLKRPDVNYDTSEKHISKALKYEKNLYTNLDMIFTMSNWLRKSFIKDFSCDPKKVISVGAGINLNSDIGNVEKNYDENIILFIGVDFVRKGGKVLLDAFRRVKDEIKDAKLIIVGHNLNSSDKDIISYGRINKADAAGERLLKDLYHKASIFVMPSYYEPFGIVFVEAMSHKLPCIGTSTCAINEIIEDGHNGYVVPVGNSQILANRIIKLLKSRTMIKEFGIAGYHKYANNYTWDIVAGKINDNLVSQGYL